MKGQRVLVVDDEKDIRDSVSVILRKEGFETEVAEAARPALKMLDESRFHLVLSDFRLPDLDGLELLRLIRLHHKDTEVVIMTGYGTIDTAVEAMRDGAYDFVQKPVKRAVIVKTVAKALEKRALSVENERLKAELSSVREPKQVIATSDVMRQTIEMAQQVAQSAATILITGESGTGKEVIANVIHANSARQSKPFVKMSCAAIPETLLEAELFGHERGAFTGAVNQRKGRFEMADQGTLFLDEVGEMSPATQVKLLRVLQEGEFERLGGSRTLQVDVRVIAATNTDLMLAIEERRFRKDLFYRLNVINIPLPALRERQEDIPLLADYFLRRWCAKNGREIDGIAPDAMARLSAYAWPGNVRELENVMERAVVLSRDAVIDTDDLPPTFGGTEPDRREIRIAIGTKMEEAERMLIDETLKHTGGNKEQAARLLGIAARTIYRKLPKN